MSDESFSRQFWHTTEETSEKARRKIRIKTKENRWLQACGFEQNLFQIHVWKHKNFEITLQNAGMFISSQMKVHFLSKCECVVVSERKEQLLWRLSLKLNEHCNRLLGAKQWTHHQHVSTDGRRLCAETHLYAVARVRFCSPERKEISQTLGEHSWRMEENTTICISSRPPCRDFWAEVPLRNMCSGYWLAREAHRGKGWVDVFSWRTWRPQYTWKRNPCWVSGKSRSQHTPYKLIYACWNCGSLWNDSSDFVTISSAIFSSSVKFLT